MSVRGWAAAAVMVLVALAAGAPAGADTACSFGGPTPGWRAVRLDLPVGSGFVTLELSGDRTPRVVADDGSWHLAQGIFVVDADSLSLVAYRLSSAGMAPRSVVVDAGGDAVRQPVTAPEVGYAHAAARLRASLPPGSYYVIAFGSDGDGRGPNEWWSAGVQVSGTHACTPIGEGEVFDFNQTDFREGTQVFVPGAGHAEDISLAFDSPRSVVVGLIDAETQGRAVSDIRVDYATPSAQGSVSQQIVPFVSTAGEYQFQASYTGYSPVVAVAGVSVDLP